MKCLINATTNYLNLDSDLKIRALSTTFDIMDYTGLRYFENIVT